MFSSRARNERIEQARREAAAAKDDAAGVFLELDDAQRMTQALVDAYAQVEPGPKADRIRSQLAPLVSAGDRAVQDYIAVTDQHAELLTAAAPDLDRLTAAHRAFRDSGQRLQEARTGLEQFRARHMELQDRLQEIQRRVRPATARAEAALARARQAVAAVGQAGIRSADLEARTVRVEQLATVVAQGAFHSGAQAAIQAADELAEAAEETVTAAQRLLTLKEKGASRLASSRTRLSGIEGRIPLVRETLSYLRRTFSLACSEDLDHVPTTAAAEIASARTLLDQVAQAQEAGDWDAAASRMEQARDHLGAAEEGINGVVARKRDLDAIADDPEAERERVRFAVRDAQRLVVSAGARAPAGEAGILDQLAARLEAAPELLEGTHPDYWSYLVELRSIRDLTAAVVRRTRAGLAG